jgi:hypothetical protein
VLKIRCIYECRCDERLQPKTKEFTRLVYTGLVVELEHLKIETRLLIDKKFASAMVYPSLLKLFITFVYSQARKRRLNGFTFLLIYFRGG